ncbi:GNAT family N-acetyltransferase [Bacillus sp. ISL-37]|jgi:N-acetylglutamate synthase-like GNAT family acetyltransferase|uniref:GNAT family N-acetyltransferase n=1 Tax=Bacillus sp. ISL-37 TaxID=2819123 RepID=UPI001BE5092B|nr:GNAT family N-acetyltransferase [Bacillus sp. ISL-37]MBT2682210.1 GNAT family N-acetyltransferase [Bacillus sp. ISL-37]
MLDKILELEFAYLATFTARHDREWGFLFINENQPVYYDANHAHVRKPVEHPANVVEEVISFYQEKNIIPRFYIYTPAEQPALLRELKSKGFGYEELPSPVQLWDQKVMNLERNDAISIEEVTEANYQEALEIECSIKEIGGREVREKALKEEFDHPAYQHFLLRYNGVACSTACIFAHGRQARMESVATLEEYRGKGLIGYIIQHIQQVVEKQGFENLWVFPINERVEKVYNRYGFDTVMTLTTGHAFLGGKSIIELQNR